MPTITTVEIPKGPEDDPKAVHYVEISRSLRHDTLPPGAKEEPCPQQPFIDAQGRRGITFVSAIRTISELRDVAEDEWYRIAAGDIERAIKRKNQRAGAKGVAISKENRARRNSGLPPLPTRQDLVVEKGERRDEERRRFRAAVAKVAKPGLTDTDIANELFTEFADGKGSRADQKAKLRSRINTVLKRAKRK